MMARLTHKSKRRNGLSLLEVMLAIAILGVAMVMLTQLIRIGVRSGENAQKISYAQILCDTKMAELSSAVIPLESSSNTDIEEAPGWVYSVDVQDAEQIGLLKVRVVVTQAGFPEGVGRSCTLTRLMPDPNYDPYEPEEE